jgi:hypothetical protein
MGRSLRTAWCFPPCGLAFGLVWYSSCEFRIRGCWMVPRPLRPAPGLPPRRCTWRRRDCRVLLLCLPRGCGKSTNRLLVCKDDHWRGMWHALVCLSDLYLRNRTTQCARYRSWLLRFQCCKYYETQRRPTEKSANMFSSPLVISLPPPLSSRKRQIRT